MLLHATETRLSFINTICSVLKYLTKGRIRWSETKVFYKECRRKIMFTVKKQELQLTNYIKQVNYTK